MVLMEEGGEVKVDFVGMVGRMVVVGNLEEMMVVV